MKVGLLWPEQQFDVESRLVRRHIAEIWVTHCVIQRHKNADWDGEREK
jgi:hypothetical protein